MVQILLAFLFAATSISSMELIKHIIAPGKAPQNIDEKKAQHADRVDYFLRSLQLGTAVFTEKELLQLLPHVDEELRSKLITKLVETDWSSTHTLLKSAAFFYPSVLINLARYGTGFSCTVIIPTTRNMGVPTVDKGPDGQILNIDDGKRTPLLLGSIPMSMDHLQQITSELNWPINTTILLYTLNRHFECSWTGLYDLLRQKEHLLIQFHYPTTDYSAPSFIDMLRGIRDLGRRDMVTGKTQIAFIHCKAGHGRSAVELCGYLLYVCHAAEVDVSVQKIVNYVQGKRPRVNLNDDHRELLNHLEAELKKAGSFEQLLAKYAPVIEKRDEYIRVNQEAALAGKYDDASSSVEKESGESV